MAKNIDMPANIREIIEKYGENYMGVLKFGTDEEKKIVTKWFEDTIQRLQDEKACDQLINQGGGGYSDNESEIKRLGQIPSLFQQ